MHALDHLLGTPDLWDTLAAEKRDILLYGMGNGADKILAVLAKRGIPVAGVFASDGFVRGQTFHGMSVRSFSEVCDTYESGECVVLVAFGTARPEVLALIDRVAQRYPLFLPDVPVCGDTLFDTAFVKQHYAQILSARALLANDASRRIFDLTLAYKLTGRYDILMDACEDEARAREVLQLQNVRHMVDLGAYNGDTAREMLALAPLSYILCAEPDKRNFRKLSAWSSQVTGCRVDCHNVAVLDQNGYAAFDASGNRNAGLCTGRADAESSVATATVDALLQGERADYIKYDVEGAEAAALCGSRQTLLRDLPRLRIAAYHRSEDIFALPLLLQELVPDKYQLYMTRRRCVPAWDLDLLAVPL